MSSPKSRLTDQEKKNNHIASEQKRRQAIREGFDRLATIVPGMEGQGRSEAIVLDATVRYMTDALQQRQLMLAKAKEMGIDTKDFEIPGLVDKDLNGTGSSSTKG